MARSCNLLIYDAIQNKKKRVSQCHCNDGTFFIFHFVHIERIQTAAGQTKHTHFSHAFCLTHIRTAHSGKVFYISIRFLFFFFLRQHEFCVFECIVAVESFHHVYSVLCLCLRFKYMRSFSPSLSIVGQSLDSLAQQPYQHKIQ